MHFNQKLIPRFAFALVLVAAIVPAHQAVFSGNRHAHSTIQILGQREDGTVGSTNWSGYAVRGTNVTDARGSWVVPAVDCSGGTANHYASFWTGIDGYSDNTVEQTGTDSDCVKGVPTYYGWFEFFPSASFNIGDFPVTPGDNMEAEVSYDESSLVFTLHLHDVTTGQSFKISSAVPNAKRTSAEWIAEAPSNAKKVLPLSQFGTVFFGHYYTSVATTNYATVNGTTGAIGTFPKVEDIVMVNQDGDIKALPSPLSANGSSFAVTRESND